MTLQPIKPTSLSLTREDKELFDRIHAKTGIPRIVIIRRLLAAYASGGRIPGLPLIDPPIATAREHA